MIDESKKPLFVMSVDTRSIYDRLVKAQVGEVITYAELDALLGRKVREKAYASLLSARRSCEKKNRIVFGAIWNEGLKRLDDSEIVDTSESAFRHIRRSSRRAINRITTVDFDHLPDEKKIKHNAAMSIFSALAVVSKPSSVLKIEARVEETKASLPLAKTLEIFSK